MAQLSEAARRTRPAAILWTVVVGALTTLVALYAFQAPSLPAPVPDDADRPAPVRGALVLPHDPPEWPPGPHREQFLISCSICHSTRLVMNQPAFPREKWAEAVAKMVKTYGAPITSEEESQIVDYLAAARGQ